MQKRNKVLAGVLTGALVLSAGPMALAATANYNDSSVTGGSAAWQDWVKEWETVAADYTKVSLTPGADETQMNFAWYSRKGEDAGFRYGKQADLSDGTDAEVKSTDAGGSLRHRQGPPDRLHWQGRPGGRQPDRRRGLRL